MTVNLQIAERAFGNEAVQTCSARNLHAELGVAKDFTSWVKRQITRAMLVEGRDYLVTQEGEQLPSGTKWRAEYHLTLNAGKHIAMMSGTAKGGEVRDYFLECERHARAQVPAVKDPQIAALITALVRVDAVEQEQKRQAAELARVQESVAVLEARTQPENKHFTVAGWMNLKGHPVDLRTAALLGRRCADLSRAQGVHIGDVTDPRFGKVHTYHESILEAVCATDVHT